MSSGSGISRRVLDGLVEAGLMTSEQVANVIETARSEGTHEGAVLSERAYVSPLDVLSVLERELGVPQVDLSSYAPEADAIALVSPSVARSYKMLPLFEIEGMLTVAVGDPMDVFALDSVAASLGMEVEPVLADPVSVAAALEQYYPAGTHAFTDAQAADVAAARPAEHVFHVEQTEEAPGQGSSVVPTPPAVERGHSASVDKAVEMERIASGPAPSGPDRIDLDVLAVADARNVAKLVARILEDAVRHGAERIHLLPYKDDFFLVYRTKGGLEKIASAPVSLQAALVEGFKQYARLGSVPDSRPALGRVRAKIAEQEFALTVSIVPTIAGQRLVVSISTVRTSPRGLEELGASEAEARALHAMVERGRGVLLLCAPVAGGAEATYYALLAHAASAGKTVYSIERSVLYEIPAVAQVMVEPGGPSRAAYLSAGLRQDTDVIAVDGLRDVEDVHLAIEAAAAGKLVIATFPAADIASGVWRMLALGAEPVSLSSALTLAVGQRLLRLNCSGCSVETDGALASQIPGAPADLRDKSGSGCPRCGKTGFRGTTAIFEVLPFTESVRAAISRARSEADVADAAASAGMRPLIAAGLAKVKSGEVSADELNRVLRFAG